MTNLIALLAAAGAILGVLAAAGWAAEGPAAPLVDRLVDRLG